MTKHMRLIHLILSFYLLYKKNTRPLQVSDWSKAAALPLLPTQRD